MKCYSLIIILFSVFSCKTAQVPTDLLGKWEKVEYGQVMDDGSEILSNIENDSCPNDYYLFLKNAEHSLVQYNMTNNECEELIQNRTFVMDNNEIIVNGGKYFYTIEKLSQNYLKLYLHNHQFTDTDSEDKNTIFIYTFIKSN